MAHAQRVDEAVERLGARLVDGVEELLGRCLAEAFPFFQRRLAGFFELLFQREDVLRGGDDAFSMKQFDLLLAEAFDVEGAARDEMLQALDGLRRADEAASAAAIDLIAFVACSPHGLRAAERALVRKDERLCALGPLL